MKVYIVSSVPAFPTNAGNRARVRQLIRAVQSLGHDVSFVFLPAIWRQSDDAAHQALLGEGRFIRLGAGADGGVSLGERLAGQWKNRVLKPLRRLRTALSARAGLDAGYYTGLDAMVRPAWLRQLRAIGADADVVIVEYVFNSRVFQAFPADALRIIDTHDAFGDRHKPYKAQGLTHGFWISLRPAAEARGLRRADAVLAIQAEEAGTFAGILGEAAGAPDISPDISVVSHVLDLGDPVTDYGAGNAALFLASDNPSNVLSIRYFIDEVLPLVLAERPEFRLKLVGPICKAVPDGPGIDKLGRVELLREAFTAAPVMINPMLVGTGINIKLLDAMAAGVVTVSTETGLRGLPDSYRAGTIALPDRDAAGFAAQVLRLTGDAALRAELGQAALREAGRWNDDQLAALQATLQRPARPRG